MGNCTEPSCENTPAATAIFEKTKILATVLNHPVLQKTIQNVKT